MTWAPRSVSELFRSEVLVRLKLPATSRLRVGQMDLRAYGWQETESKLPDVP